MNNTDNVLYLEQLIPSHTLKERLNVIQIMLERVIPVFQDETTKVNNYYNILSTVRCHVRLK